MNKLGILCVLMLFSLLALGQDKPSNQKYNAVFKGKVTTDQGVAIEGANIALRSLGIGTKSDANGLFSLNVPSDKNLEFHISYIGFETKTFIKRLENGETYSIIITLKSNSRNYKDVIIKETKKRNQAGNVGINYKMVDLLPSTVGGIEGLLKVFLSNNNELTSQYNVRGGNFDENLVYINDFEVYRPFLVRSGQQEGLSIINPDLVGGVNFSTGGFQSKYGDKMSSVLDITYKRPKEFAATATASMLGLAAHVEGTGIKNRMSYMVGVRQKSNQYLLQSQQTKGVYNPSFTDVQTFVNYQFNTDWQIDVFANYARNRFDFQPESSTQSFGLINKAFQLQTYFTGAEIDKFDSRYGGISLTHTPSKNKNLTLKLIASGFQTNEEETYDIQGEYLLGELETDLGKSNFGDIKYAIGTGKIHNYARNYLNVNVANIGHKGSYDIKQHFVQWGLNAEIVNITDKLNEWERRDSAGFTQPYSDTAIFMAKRYKSSQDFSYNRFSGFIQDNIAFDSIGLVLTGGVRFNYNMLNSEFLVSPRLQLSWKPKWKKDIIFRAATGVYSQPPFYREMRDLNGDVNLDLKAQKSLHAVAGVDYNFKAFGDRPFKFTSELYYKYMWDLVPYEYDNVRIRYFGKNMAKGYAYGIEGRLYGDIVKNAESWVSVGVMKTGEDIIGDEARIRNADGDTVTIQPGYIPRPTDSRVSFGIFFSDYLPGNKNFKLFLNGLYSTGLPFGPPNQSRFDDTLRIPSYKRVDIGFSSLILDGSRKDRPRYSYFKNVKSMWLSLEVFNLLGIQNTLSYLWIQDQTTSRTYAVPNRLTRRLLNVKLAISF